MKGTHTCVDNLKKRLRAVTDPEPGKSAIGFLQVEKAIN
ncbi:hypothetical protein OKW40_000769 [Paraburkholderia sp. RAU6.4a]